MEEGVREQTRDVSTLSRTEEIIRTSITVGAGITAAALFWRRVRYHINVSRAVQFSILPNVRPRQQHKHIFNELCTRLKLPHEKLRLGVGQSVVSECVGSCHFRQGAAVLLARNSTWTSRNDVTASGFTFENKPLNMRSSADRTLADVMLLEDKVVKFMMGHELIHIKHMDFLIEGLHDAAHVIVAYLLGVLLAPYSLGVIPGVWVQACVWAAVAAVHRKNEARLSVWQEFKADRCAAALGVDMCDAGVEWCQQKLRLGRICRQRNLQTGKLIYSEDGDILDTSTHPSVKQRLQMIEQVKKHLKT